MYHPEMIRRRITQLEDELHPPTLQAYTVAEVDEWMGRLQDVIDDKGAQTRPLDNEELAFVLNELTICKADFIYWLERYAYINAKGLDLIRPYPLRDAQRLILNRLAELELACYNGERDEGLLVLILKARQQGASTLWQLLMAHVASTQTNRFGLTASAEPPKSSYLFQMFQRTLDNLPFFMSPRMDICKRTFPEEVRFSTGTNIWAAAGKSTAGMKASQSDRATRGQLARGMTISLAHLSEISTWETPQQINSAFLPAVPMNEPRVLVGLESTAKGTNSWWHRTWNLAKLGENRFTPIFTPWYAEPAQYRLRASITWQPLGESVRYSDRVFETSARWMGGRQYRLSRDQLFWYESTRKAYEADGDLQTFLEEFPADDEEAFQASSDASVPPAMLQRIIDHARPMVGAVEIAPAYILQDVHPEEWVPTVR